MGFTPPKRSTALHGEAAHSACQQPQLPNLLAGFAGYCVSRVRVVDEFVKPGTDFTSITGKQESCKPHMEHDTDGSAGGQS